ncbi:MAG: glutamine-hydrolyzing GMP synthase, partial [Acidimicrobiales bacterium]
MTGRAAVAALPLSGGHDTVVVVDFGAQYAQLIARRVREARVHSVIVSHRDALQEILARQPKGIILSGGPKSVHVEGAPSVDPTLWEAGVPVLGICYGAQLMAQELGGTVSRTGRGEYGRAELARRGSSPLLAGLADAAEVWMSHTDSITAAPTGFAVTASAPQAAVAAMEDPGRGLYGVQFHPEVAHTPGGQGVLERFLYDACGCRPTWTHTSIIAAATEAVRAQVGGDMVLCALSGGVDSSVAAALVSAAVGDQLTCVFVDTGLMRAGEADQVEQTFRRHLGIDLVHVKAADRFFSALEGIADPERKRKAVGETFIRVFEEVAAEHADARYLVQGTLYPDVIESGSGSAARIKSHHNVGGLPEQMDLELVEPLRDLFKDEVR